MDDLISRADAIDVLAYFTEKSLTGRTAQELVKALPSAQPTIDAVEVVRCRKCKWWTIVDNISVPLHTCKKFDGVRYGEDYCSRAERSEET